MWKPSVNAIWLRAGVSSARRASGRSSASDRLGVVIAGVRRSAAFARRSTSRSITWAPRIAGPVAEPVGEHLHALPGRAAEVASGARRDRWEMPSGPDSFEAPDLADRLAPADHGQCALVEILERRRGARPPLPIASRRGVACWIATVAEARQRLAVGPGMLRCRRSREISGWPGRVRSGLTSMRPPRSVVAPAPQRGTGSAPRGARRRPRSRCRRRSRSVCPQPRWSPRARRSRWPWSPRAP